MECLESRQVMWSIHTHNVELISQCYPLEYHLTSRTFVASEKPKIVKITSLALQICKLYIILHLDKSITSDKCHIKIYDIVCTTGKTQSRYHQHVCQIQETIRPLAQVCHNRPCWLLTLSVQLVGDLWRKFCQPTDFLFTGIYLNVCISRKGVVYKQPNTTQAHALSIKTHYSPLVVKFWCNKTWINSEAIDLFCKS